jgi:hypothetical protein
VVKLPIQNLDSTVKIIKPRVSEEIGNWKENGVIKDCFDPCFFVLIVDFEFLGQFLLLNNCKILIPVTRSCTKEFMFEIWFVRPQKPLASCVEISVMNTKTGIATTTIQVSCQFM